MKIALAQINPIVGDLQGNAAKILDACLQAHKAGASLLVTPAMALTGYPVQDWLLRQEFLSTCERVLQQLAAKLPPLTVVIGHPQIEDGRLFNAASVICEGRTVARHFKKYLSFDSAFDEQRYFTAGDIPCTFEHNGSILGLAIGEDAYQMPYLQTIRRQGAQLLLAMHAIPYRIDQHDERLYMAKTASNQTALAAIHVNLVGGQDELVFDGASFAVDSRGRITHQSASFQETLSIVEWNDGQLLEGVKIGFPEQLASIYHALCLGIQDFIDKNDFPGVLIGLSGGVDSALVLAIAVDALGRDRVTTVMLSSPYTADISREDARTMAQNLGVKHMEIPIDTIFAQHQQTLSPHFQSLPAIPAAVTFENLQARIRAVLLMALSNQSGLLLINTSNKSEVAVGYSTLYGDMAGGFALLKDVSKTLVYALCHYRNQLGSVIPQRILLRPPSAELRPNQTDQDSLPPYPLLDAIVEAYVERGCSIEEIIAMGHSRSLVQRVIKLIHASEYKRRQAAPGIRLTRRDFGKSWHFPLTSRFLQ